MDPSGVPEPSTSTVAEQPPLEPLEEPDAMQNHPDFDIGLSVQSIFEESVGLEFADAFMSGVGTSPMKEPGGQSQPQSVGTLETEATTEPAFIVPPTTSAVADPPPTFTASQLDASNSSSPLRDNDPVLAQNSVMASPKASTLYHQLASPTKYTTLSPRRNILQMPYETPRTSAFQPLTTMMPGVSTPPPGPLDLNMADMTLVSAASTSDYDRDYDAFQQGGFDYAGPSSSRSLYGSSGLYSDGPSSSASRPFSYSFDDARPFMPNSSQFPPIGMAFGNPGHSRQEPVFSAFRPYVASPPEDPIQPVHKQVERVNLLELGVVPRDADVQKLREPGYASLNNMMTSEEIIGYIGELKSMYTTSTDPDFHNRWPEFAALECALAARYERYNKLKGRHDNAEMNNAMDAHVAKVRLEESRLTLARAIRRLDRFVALAQLRGQELREKFNNCVSLNDAFRTLLLPTEAVFDRKRNDLYAWEEDERLKRSSYPHYFDFYEKIVDDDGELKFRCLFDKCTYNFSTGDKRDGFGRPVKRTWPTMIGMLQRHQMKHTRVKTLDPGKLQRGRGRPPAAARLIHPSGGDRYDVDATPLHPDDAGYGTPTGSATGNRSGHAQSSSAADYFTMYARESRDLLDSDDGDDCAAGGVRQKRGGMAARGGKRGRGRPPGSVRGRSSMTARPQQCRESLNTDSFLTTPDFGLDLSEESSDEGEEQELEEEPSEPGLKKKRSPCKPKAPRKRSGRPVKKLVTGYLERYEQIVQDGQVVHKCREDGCDFAVDSNDCEDLLDALRDHFKTMHRANLAPTPSSRKPKKPSKAPGGKRQRARPDLSPLRHSMDPTQFDDDCPAGYASAYEPEDDSAAGPSAPKRGRRQEAVMHQPMTKWSTRPATTARLMRSDWPEFQALFEDFNAKFKHYVDLMLEVERGGAVDVASQRILHTRYKAYKEASGRCGKFIALSKEQPAELRLLITDEGKSIEEVFAALMTEEELNPPPEEEKPQPKPPGRRSKKAAAGDASFSLYDDNDPFAEGWASDHAADHDTSGASDDADEQIVKEYYERLEVDSQGQFRCRFTGCECVYNESSDVSDILVNHFRLRHKHEPKPVPSSLPKWPEYQVLCEKAKEQKRLYSELHSTVQNELDADAVRAMLDKLETRKLELERADLRQKQFALIAQRKPRELRQMLDDGSGFNEIFAAIEVKDPDSVPYDELEDLDEDVDANGRNRQRIYYDLFCTRKEHRSRLYFDCTMEGCEFQCDFARTYNTVATIRKLKAHFFENHLSNGNATNPTEGARRPYTFWDEWPQLAEMHDRLQLLESLTQSGSTRESNHAELKKLQTRCEAADALINHSAGKFHALLDAGMTLEEIVQRMAPRLPWRHQYKLGFINWDGSAKNADHEDSPDIPTGCNTPDETWDAITTPTKLYRVWSPNENSARHDSASPPCASSPVAEEPGLVIDEDNEAMPEEEHAETSATTGEPSSSKAAGEEPMEEEKEIAEEHPEAGEAAEFSLDPADWPTVEVDLIRLDHLDAAEYEALYRTIGAGVSKCLYEGCSFAYDETGKHLSARAAFRAHYQCVHFNCGLNSEHYLAMCDCFK